MGGKRGCKRTALFTENARRFAEDAATLATPLLNVIDARRAKPAMWNMLKFGHGGWSEFGPV